MELKYPAIFSWIILLMVFMFLTACSDAASRASNPDISNRDLPISIPQDLSVSTNDGVVTLTWSDVILIII